MSAYEPFIGLEVHAELKTSSKMFCACTNDPNEQHPNVNVCPVCLGHPGTLPVPNREAIALVQRVGAALGCTLAAFSKFDRKNYFYPDLPKGYQISQYDLPFCEGGKLELENGHTVRIRRIHLEEDTGKLVHPDGEQYSSVDFNRAGIPLMELVTEPDLRSAEDVSLFAEELQRILRYLGASDANMEKGEMRVEVNISLQPLAEGRGGAVPETPSGTKVEIKNLNSIRSARMAVAFEIDRQSRLLDDGKAVEQETRGWHDTKQATFSQRSKEEAHDYRYFPEPDIPPFRFTEADFEKLRAELPELPQARRARFREEYGLGGEAVRVFVDDKAMGEYFEQVVSELFEWVSSDPGVELSRERLIKLAANYLLSDLRGILQEHSAPIDDIRITPENFAELVKIVAKGEVTSRVAKDVLREMFSTGADPSAVIAEQGLLQVTDEAEIRKAVEQAVAENPQPVADFKGGKAEALQFLVGKVMAQTKGKANPMLAQEMLKQVIGK